MASWQSRSKRQGSRVQGEPHRRASFSLTQVPGGGSLPKERGSGENATHEGGWGCRTASQRQLIQPPAHKAAHQGAHELKGASYQGGGKPKAQAAVRGRRLGGGRGRRVGLREGGRWRHQQLAAPPSPAPGCWTGAQELRGASNQARKKLFFALGVLHRRHYTWRVPQVPRADQIEVNWQGRAENGQGGRVQV
jgi:hypothetical protein